MDKNEKRVQKQDLPRKRVTISIDETLLEWADQAVEKGFKYKDRSHVFEYALARLREDEEKE